MYRQWVGKSANAPCRALVAVFTHPQIAIMISKHLRECSLFMNMAAVLCQLDCLIYERKRKAEQNMRWPIREVTTPGAEASTEAGLIAG